MDKVTVYITLGNEDRVCEYGGKHNVKLYTTKFLYSTGEEYLSNNGYEKRMLPVYRDGQGRVWKKHVSIDYSNNVYYTCEDAGVAFRLASPRPPYQGVDVNG